MRLRQRFADLLKERCAERLPEALATVWDTAGVVVAVESLKFESSGGEAKPGWWSVTDFSGVLRVELRADGIDTLPVEPLIVSLVNDTPHLFPDDETPEGGWSEMARARLIEWKDGVREMQVVSALRFEVKGGIVARDDGTDAPGAMIGQAPEIGLGHEEDYKPLDEWTGVS